MVGVGAITSFHAPQVQANEPTPWIGVYERINAYGYMLWMIVLAVALWRNPFEAGPYEDRPYSSAM